MSDRAAIIVVNYAAHALIAANLSAETATAANLDVVIVDNFSTVAERQAMAALCAQRNWHFVPLDTNRGFGAGVNAGVRAAIEHGAKIFVTLNPDASSTSEVLKSLVREVQEHPETIVAPYIADSTGRLVFRGSMVSRRTGQIRGGWHANDDDPEWKNWLTGACLVFDQVVFEALGGMSEEYFLYWEDVDFSRRAARCGIRLVLRKDLTIIHDEGATHTARGSRARSAVYYYYNTRNRLLFAARVWPEVLSAWRWQTPRQSLLIWLRGGRKQLLTYPRGAWAALRGSLSGLLIRQRPFTPMRPAKVPEP